MTRKMPCWTKFTKKKWLVS